MNITTLCTLLIGFLVISTGMTVDIFAEEPNLPDLPDSYRPGVEFDMDIGYYENIDYIPIIKLKSPGPSDYEDREYVQIRCASTSSIVGTACDDPYATDGVKHILLYDIIYSSVEEYWDEHHSFVTFITFIYTASDPVDPVDPTPVNLKKPGGGGNDKFKSAPTFGKSLLTNNQIVECGFSIDGKCIDVLDYNVKNKMEIIKTNSTHDFTLKVFSQRDLKCFQIGFGISQVGSPINSAEALIEVHLEKPNGEYVIDEIKVIDKTNTIDLTPENVNISMAKCMSDSTDEKCVELSLDNVLFREQLHDEEFVINAIDAKRYVTNHYMNEGILINGSSLNPPLTNTLQDNKITFNLIRTDKLNDIWTDQFGYTWTKNNHNTWFQLITPEFVKTLDGLTDVMTRYHSDFINSVNKEKIKATMIFNGTKLVKTLPSSFTYDYGTIDRNSSKAQFLADQILIEQQNAKKIVDAMMKLP